MASKTKAQKKPKSSVTQETLERTLAALTANPDRSVDYRIVDRAIHLMLMLGISPTKRKALTKLRVDHPDLNIRPATYWHRLKMHYKNKYLPKTRAVKKPAVKNDKALEAPADAQQPADAQTTTVAGNTGNTLMSTQVEMQAASTALSGDNSPAAFTMLTTEEAPVEEKPLSEKEKRKRIGKETRRLLIRAGNLTKELEYARSDIRAYENHIRQLATNKGFTLDQTRHDDLVFIVTEELTAPPDVPKDRTALMQDNMNFQRMITHLEGRIATLNIQIDSKNDMLERMAQEHNDESHSLRERSEKEIELMKAEVHASEQAAFNEAKAKWESETALLRQEIERLSAVNAEREKQSTELKFQRIEVDKPIILVRTKLFLEKDPRPSKLIYLLPNGKVEGVEAEFPEIEE